MDVAVAILAGQVNSVMAPGITTTTKHAAERSVLTHHGVVQQGRLLPAPHSSRSPRCGRYFCSGSVVPMLG
jgi:hypothetical protein